MAYADCPGICQRLLPLQTFDALGMHHSRLACPSHHEDDPCSVPIDLAISVKEYPGAPARFSAILQHHDQDTPRCASPCDGARFPWRLLIQAVLCHRLSLRGLCLQRAGLRNMGFSYIESDSNGNNELQASRRFASPAAMIAVVLPTRLSVDSSDMGRTYALTSERRAVVEARSDVVR